MMKTREILKIQNLNNDIVSSNMLDDFKTQFSRREGIQLVDEEHMSPEGEKGFLSSAVSFLINIAINTISGLIVEYLKNVYARHKKPEAYEWNVAIERDNGLEKVTYQVIVCQTDGVITVRKIGTRTLSEE